MIQVIMIGMICGPAPHGAGGLKSVYGQRFDYRRKSRPARGGWIEIILGQCKDLNAESRPARGGWIEIPIYRKSAVQQLRPAPHGAGGLKSIWTKL